MKREYHRAIPHLFQTGGVGVVISPEVSPVVPDGATVDATWCDPEGS